MAANIEMRRQYAEWIRRFWETHTTLAQVVVEDFPDPDSPEARPERYHLDTIRDLALREEALIEGYERKT